MTAETLIQESTFKTREKRNLKTKEKRKRQDFLMWLLLVEYLILKDGGQIF